MKPKHFRPRWRSPFTLMVVGAALSSVVVSPIDQAGAVTVPKRPLPLPDPLSKAIQQLDHARYAVAPVPTAADFSADKSFVSGWDDFVKRNAGSWRLQVDQTTGAVLLAEGSGIPWVPGTGNHLAATRAVAGAAQRSTLDDVAGVAGQFLTQQQPLLRVPAGNLVLDRKASVGFGKNNRYWTLRYDYVLRDPALGPIPVRGAYLFFRVNHGNLVQFGNHQAVAPVGINTSGLVERKDAVASAAALLGSPPDLQIRDAAKDVGQADRSLLVVPVAVKGGGPGAFAHQLVRALAASTGALEYELWFDAHSGALVNAIDLAQNLEAAVTAGIFPVTNTDPLVNRGLPFLNVSDGAALITDLAGGYSYTPATVASAAIDGQYIHIVDGCGASSLSTSISPGDIGFGAAVGGTDCATPGFGGAGNTNAARSAYYHLNLIKDKARRILNDPVVTTPWLDASLTTNVNVSPWCNAQWLGGPGTLNFYTADSGCSNTGEISAIFLHEFGHGLDQNTNGAPPEKGSGEAYADTMAFLQTHQSCIGDNFQPGVPCPYGCGASCTGVRDVGVTPKVTPATIESGPSNCLVNGFGFCPYFGYEGPMGYEGHCESLLASGAIWDLAQGLVTAYGDGAGWALADRLWYESLYSTESAYQLVSGGQCNPAATVDGCGADNWYTVLLGLDDDDGDLTNGTPNAATIWNAFNGHGIACGASAPPVSSTCTAPAAADPLTATATGAAVDLSWTAVAGATSYKVFRNEFSCSAGSTPIAEVVAPATTYHDTLVHPGTTYYYAIQTVGAADTCVSTFTTCHSALPTIPLNPANIVMVLDQSGSMIEPTDVAGETKIAALKNASQMVIDAAAPYSADGVRVGAVSFASAVTGDTGLKDPGDLSPGGDHAQLMAFVNALSPTTATAIGQGLNEGLTVFPAVSTNQKVLMLLSDGIQNVPPNLAANMAPPGASVGGAALPSDVRFYTVALGTNVQQDLFDALATVGGIPGFFYSGGTAAVQANFAFWLGSALGLGSGTPFSAIGGSGSGGGSGFAAAPGSGFAPAAPGIPIVVNRSVRKLTVVLTWHGGRGLRFQLLAPGGTTFTPPASAYNPAAGYATFTAPLPPESSGTSLAGIWVVQVTDPAGAPASTPFDLYSLFDDGAIRDTYSVGGTDPGAGESLPVTVRLSEFSAPLRGQKVFVRLVHPGQGLGDILSDTLVTPQQLASVQPAPGDVFQNDAQRKLAYLLKNNPGLFLPGAPGSVALTESAPGVYQAVLSGAATAIPGTYKIELAVEGHGVYNAEFDRANRFSRYLRVKPDPISTPVSKTVQVGPTALRAVITLAPQDRVGHRMGPGWGDSLVCKSNLGKFDTRVNDLLNGAYTVVLTAPLGSDPQVVCRLMNEPVVVGRLSQFKPTPQTPGSNGDTLAVTTPVDLSAASSEQGPEDGAGGCAVAGGGADGAALLMLLLASGAWRRRARRGARA